MNFKLIHIYSLIALVISINVATNSFAIPSKQFIGEINIHGNYPILENRVRRQLSISPGDQYSENIVIAQQDRIKELYERMGYFGVEVKSSSEWKEYEGWRRVDITIHKGETIRWGKIEVEGNNILPAGKIRSVFSMWRTYTTRSMRDGIRNLAKAYHKKGYAKARVRLLSKKADLIRNRMDIKLRVIQGPKVTVAVNGNKQLAEYDIKNQVSFFTEGRFDRYEIENSVERIKKRYIERGYSEPSVSFKRERITDNHWHVTFTIIEGIYQTVWSMNFVGNKQRSDSTLLSKVLTRPLSLTSAGILKPEVLEEDIVAIEEYYQEEGFADASIGPATVDRIKDKDFLKIDIKVDEGKRYKVSSVKFKNTDPSEDQKILKGLRLVPDKYANLSLKDGDRQTVLLYFQDNGFPYAKVSQSITKDSTKGEIEIEYVVNRGQEVKIGEIEITGDFITSQKAIKRSLAIRTGDQYSERKILDSVINLRRLGAFRNVTIEKTGLKNEAKIINLVIKIEEERPYIIETDLGYSTEDHITGALRFVNINTFGWAKRTQLNLIGGQERARAEVSWIDPRFLSKDLFFTTNTWIDRNDDIAFDRVQAGASAGIVRQYHRTGFNFRYQLERNRILDARTATADEGLRDNTISKVSAGINYDTRDNFSAPKRGIYLFATADLNNEINGLRADFVRTETGASNYLHLGKGITLSQHARFGNIQSIGTAAVPITERFFLGGDDTVRGFTEDDIGPKSSSGNPLGGNVRLIYNAELSFPLMSNIRIAGFFDAGTLTNSFSELSLYELRESGGLGIRYVTPVGPLRADYGFKLDRRANESKGRFHFTFGHVF